MEVKFPRPGDDGAKQGAYSTQRRRDAESAELSAEKTKRGKG
jgi:hypothetical protein